MEECWYISDQLHTSYTDVLDMSVMERHLLLELIKKKIDNTNEALAAITENSGKN